MTGFNTLQGVLGNGHGSVDLDMEHQRRGIYSTLYAVAEGPELTPQQVLQCVEIVNNSVPPTVLEKILEYALSKQLEVTTLSVGKKIYPNCLLHPTGFYRTTPIPNNVKALDLNRTE